MLKRKKNIRLAKNLLANNTCSTCKYCIYEMRELITLKVLGHWCNFNRKENTSVELEETCENWIPADVLSDIQEN